jgi:hypothetical protein
LNATKEHYPFSRWIVEGGPPQYTQKSCADAAAIFDRLIAKLISIGEKASDEAKIAAFRKAVEALNALNDETSNLIETGECEQLCVLLAQIGIAAGMPPSKFPDEEGAASGRRLVALKPNKAPEPTPGSVTPRATSGDSK